VDVGTNTVRLLVAGRDDGGGTVPLLRMRRITAMGKALRATGRIGADEFAASLEALRSFREAMDRLGVSACRAVGTAAIREAENGPAFLEAARKAGIPLEEIDAREEASLALRGVRHALRREKGPFLLMDVGGGSTELVAGDGEGEMATLPIGVVVALAVHRLSDPPKPWEARNLDLFYRERAAAAAALLPRRRYRFLAGTAGSFTTLAALDLRMDRYDPARIDGHSMTLDRLVAWRDRLLGLTDAERLALPGMEKGRERYIVPGTIQAAAVMERFRIRRLVVSDGGILEGILAKMIDTNGHTKGVRTWKRA
jgi:exopolyphosphatase/guanosine-5'-triphosphate,3'-diphosphate pyrophosphatase